MHIDWNPQYFDLDNLVDVARGNQKILLRYLNQFVQLVPSRLQELNGCVQEEDRSGAREVLHAMIPQLEFFGVQGVVGPIRDLQDIYLDVEWGELEERVNEIAGDLELTCGEVEELINSLR